MFGGLLCYCLIASECVTLNCVCVNEEKPGKHHIALRTPLFLLRLCRVIISLVFFCVWQCAVVCARKRKQKEYLINNITCDKPTGTTNLKKHSKDESSNRGDGYCQIKAIRFELYQEAQLLVSLAQFTRCK